MGDAARKLEADEDAVSARWAMLEALPLAEDPETDDERAALDEAERFLRSGQRGSSSADVTAMLDRMRRDQA